MLKQFLFILSLLVLSSPLHAVVITDLYQAEVPVSDQSDASQKSGLEKAMLAVLIKLTGDRNIQGRPVAEHLLKQPEKYLQQYKYRNKPIIEDNQLTLKQQLYLWASFNEAALDKTLRDYAVPVWGKVRPSALAWLTMENEEGRRYVGMEDESGFTAIMDAQARARGIVISHPLLDSEDRSTLNITDIRSGFIDPVKQASSRYQVDAILAGHMEKISDNNWQVEWISIVADDVARWNVTGPAQQVLEEGINHLADTLADRYIQSSTFAQVTGIEIEVNDIDNFEQYSRVLKYLRSLNSVTRVEVMSLMPGQVTYSLTSTGGELAIQRAIELGNILKSLTGSGSPYRLVQK